MNLEFLAGFSKFQSSCSSKTKKQTNKKHTKRKNEKIISEAKER